MTDVNVPATRSGDAKSMDGHRTRTSIPFHRLPAVETRKLLDTHSSKIMAVAASLFAMLVAVPVLT
ncbi:hypothetical protein FHR32_005485 [Streptosporangium album]|uniref:Uncharacterized protein n=1 Tax=Streptosporangium album TaxID=47479 RepID=A0A7W7S0U9_9ACTN|nr:hypothetical protein [Streptosporangium album]MBB4941108.1 hypothetical protein [Streptosporangium album]